MNVTLEKIDNTSAKLIVSVVADDYKAKVQKELKNINQKHVFPGFRKGHAPMSLIERQFGKGVLSDTINNLVFEEVYKYIEENDIHVLGDPLPVEVKEISTEVSDYTFEYEIGLSPEMDIKLDKEITIPIYPIAVDDKMIEEQDKTLRERYGSQEPGEAVDEKAIVKGVIMQLDADNNIVEGEDAIQVTAGIVAPFLFASEEQKALFMGKKLQDKVVFNPWDACNGNAAQLSSMLQVDKERVADLHDNFEITLTEIIVNKLAEHNEEFFKEVYGSECTTEEDYNKRLREMIANSLAPNSQALFARDARNKLLEIYGNVELPKEFLRKWILKRNPETNPEDLDKEFDRVLEDVKWQLIKERIAKLTEMKIEQDDLMAYARVIARQQFVQYGMTNVPDDTLDDYAKRILEDKTYRNRIIETVGDNKLFATIHAAVNSPAEEVSFDRFKELAGA